MYQKKYIVDKKIDKFYFIDEDNFILNYNSSSTVIVLAIGNLNKNLIRKSVYENYKEKGFSFYGYISSESKIYSKINTDAVLIFPSAII